MVVMLGEVLGELVVGMVATVHEPPHDTGVDQHGQAAIGRALRQRRVGAQDLGERHRTVCV
jgi:hypothetical protein